jgi:acyl carrier protein
MVDEQLLKQTILKVESGSLGPDSSNDTIPSWDSLRHMNLILALEEEFGVSIPDEEAANITSYPLIKLTLEELLQGR